MKEILKLESGTEKREEKKGTGNGKERKGKERKGNDETKLRPTTGYVRRISYSNRKTVPEH